MIQSDLVHVTSFEIRGDFYNYRAVWHEFITFVNKLTGVTVLSSSYHVFPGDGLTGVVILSESHAAIHTWPELGRAWVELVTCGDPVALIEFEQIKFRLAPSP